MPSILTYPFTRIILAYGNYPDTGERGVKTINSYTVCTAPLRTAF